jgi:hypothetical protein
VSIQLSAFDLCVPTMCFFCRKCVETRNVMENWTKNRMDGPQHMIGMHELQAIKRLKRIFTIIYNLLVVDYKSPRL